MKWYWRRAGEHTHVRVFMFGAKCGDLCFHNEEFEQIQAAFHPGKAWPIQFIEENKTV